MKDKQNTIIIQSKEFINNFDMKLQTVTHKHHNLE